MASEHSNNPTNSPDRLGGRQVDLILDQLESLPTLPEVATQLLNVTASSRSDARQVIELIQADQSLTARILSLAARADTGLRKEARTIGKAVIMLGFETVRSIVMSIKVFEMFGPSDVAAAGLDRREFWKHCIAVACAAEQLGTRLKLDIDGEELFVCGLLHDIGKLALEQCLPKSYARIVESCDAQYGNIAEYERKIIGVDHSVAGRRLAQQWQLPTQVENAIWLHHHPIEALPESLAHPKAVAIVHLADTIAREQRFGYSGNYTFPASSVKLAAQIGVSAAALGDTIDQLPGMIEKRAKLMGLGETTSEGLFRSALGNANQELGRLNRKFHRRAAQAGMQTKTLTELLAFNRKLTGRESLSQLTAMIAQTWASAMGVETDGHTHAAAYVLSRGDDTAVLSHYAGNDDTQGDLLATRKDLPSVPVPASGSPAAAAIGSILADQASLPEWAGEEGLVHQPLICGTQWVGGLLWPAAMATSALTGDASEAIVTTMALAAGITEARERAARLAEQLAQSSQQLYATQQSLTETRALATVGEMASGAAHEMNNPLAVIVGRSQLMAESAEADDKQIWLTMADQGQRISDIITSMMEFADPPAPKPEPVDIGSVVETAKAKLAAAKVELAVACDVAADTPTIHVDPDQFSDVLVELLTNARAAIEGPDARARITGEFEPMSGRVLVKVIDKGEGMDNATVENAFTPFFSAQSAGRKRGMGLSKARRLVQLAGGRIWIRSAPKEGTTVFIMLPPAADAAGAEAGEPIS